MSRFIYTKEMIDYIKANAKGRFNDDLAEMFNRRFGTSVTGAGINAVKSRHKIRSGLTGKTKRKARIFTKEQEKYIHDNYKGKFTTELTEMLNKEFDTNYKESQIRSYKQRHKLASGVSGEFTRTQVPWNKGMKGWHAPGSEKGWFKKRTRPN